MSFSGIINLNKPAGISSARAVGAVKRLLPRGTKIGHAGTLDPFATGVLLLLIGRATRLCEQLMSEQKQYETTIRLGATTETLDPESPEQVTPGATAPDAEAVRAIMAKFVGPLQQRPPAYSALKVGGRAAYKLARAGKAPVLPERLVHVYGIEILRYQWPELDLRIDCGRGTYIRSLARDIGGALGVGGYLTRLRRTRIGPFHINDSVALQEIAQRGSAEPFLKQWIPSNSLP